MFLVHILKGTERKENCTVESFVKCVVLDEGKKSAVLCDVKGAVKDGEGDSAAQEMGRVSIRNRKGEGESLGTG